MDFSSLNPQQRDAVETIEGPLLLLAGAGTGKTMVITYRIANLVKAGIPPSSILAVTFTNKAANEMKERVSQLVSARQAKDLTVSTFHSFGLRTLAKYGSLLGYTSGFTLIDYGDQIGIVKEAMSRLSYLDESGFDAPMCLAALSRAKNKNLRPEDLKKSNNADDKKIGHVYEIYQDYLHAINVMDFDDLLMQTVRLFDEFPNVLTQMKERYKFLLIDEFQDTNHIQMLMVRQLCGDKPNICAVGDDDQSIYSWRGAEITNILNFNKDFENCKVIKLEQNYRCTSNILNCANKVISINATRHDKNLWSDKDDPNKVKILTNETPEKEAATIAEVINDRVHNKENGYGDFAILYRSNHQSRVVEEKLRSQGIPYEIIGDESFYEKREIRDAVAFLNVALNRNQSLSLLRILDVPPRGIGPVTIKTLREIADRENVPVIDVIEDDDLIAGFGKAQQMALKGFIEIVNKFRELFEQPGQIYEKVKNYFTEIDYLEGLGRMYKPRADAEARYENVLELLSSINEMDKRQDGRLLLSEFIKKITIREEFSRKKSKDAEERDSVTLLTVHSAKGLEFPYVFIAGVEKNLFPHERSVKEKSLPEERRLFYVAMTRAKQELVISWCNQRKVRQKVYRSKRSQFLAELPEEYIEEVTKADLIKQIGRADMASLLRSYRDSM
ncbi:MAG: UvrD-helicase domain-containing protein [Lentisphaeraceae bacterium]|nr:UvrD-helicase domain-containing protein [Lentisphaeraceae bacterium]